MRHWAYGMRSKFFKMVSTSYNSMALTSTFSLAHSSRDILGRSGSQNLGVELSTWKPSWLHRCTQLASYRHLISVLLARIWYGQSLFLLYIIVIGRVTVSVEAVWAGRGTQSVITGSSLVVLISIYVELSLGDFYSEYCYLLFILDWGGSYFFLLQPFCPLSLLIIAAMARRRGISQRGSGSGTRGGVRGRGGPVPRRISPLASVSPASPSSDHSGPSLNSSFHSSRFTFKSKLNKPTISAIITVIFSKEEDDLSGSDEQSMDRSLSQNSKDSQGSMAGDILNILEAQQAEGHQEDSRHQQTSSHEEIIPCAPAHFSGTVLYLVMPPGCNNMDVEDNVMVEWISSPCKANDEDADLPPQA